MLHLTGAIRQQHIHHNNDSWSEEEKKGDMTNRKMLEINMVQD